MFQVPNIPDRPTISLISSGLNIRRLLKTNNQTKQQQQQPLNNSLKIKWDLFT